MDELALDGVGPYEFTQFEEQGYSDEDALDLAQGLLMEAIPCLGTIYPAFSEAQRKTIKFAVLEMAKYIKIDYFNFERSTSPFQSETIGSYTYSKAAQSVRNGASTGIPAFDRATSQFAELCNADSGAFYSSSEQVIRPGFDAYRESRERTHAPAHLWFQPDPSIRRKAAATVSNPVAKGGYGAKGDPGLSAYEVAVSAGFTGSEPEWLESLKGEPGEPGVGIANVTAVDGTATIMLTDDTTRTIDLPPGEDGLSAYEVAVENGFAGSESEWMESLKGEPGEPGEPGTDGISPELPAISWEGDRLRVGDVLSDPLTGPGVGVTETEAAPITRNYGIHGGSITLTRLGTLRILDVRDVEVSFIGGKLTLNAADAAVTSSGGMIRSATDIYPVHISGTTVTIDAKVDAQVTAPNVGGIVLWRAAS